ncbi:MAG: hypothetical protein Q4G51_03285 [Dermatophilus congolensis]|nr:hypothetical protein [Dermatophilus congolensis]
MCSQRTPRIASNLLFVLAMTAFVTSGAIRVLNTPGHASELYQGALAEGMSLGVVTLALAVGVIRLVQSVRAERHRA